jgi:hypothetical protein
MVRPVSLMMRQEIISSDGCCSLCLATGLRSDGGDHTCDCRFTTTYVVDDSFRYSCNNNNYSNCKALQFTFLPLSATDMGLFTAGGLSVGQLVGYYTGLRMRMSMNTPAKDPGLVVSRSTATLEDGRHVTGLWCVEFPPWVDGPVPSSAILSDSLPPHPPTPPKQGPEEARRDHVPGQRWSRSRRQHATRGRHHG